MYRNSLTPLKTLLLTHKCSECSFKIVHFVFVNMFVQLQQQKEILKSPFPSFSRIFLRWFKVKAISLKILKKCHDRFICHMTPRQKLRKSSCLSDIKYIISLQDSELGTQTHTLEHTRNAIYCIYSIYIFFFFNKFEHNWSLNGSTGGQFQSTEASFNV